MKTTAFIVLGWLLLIPAHQLYGNVYSDTDSLSIWVNGLCGMCKTRIEETAREVRGVSDARWDAAEKTLHFRTKGKNFRLSTLHYRLAAAGHDTRERLAPDPVYEALPGCCKYRDNDASPSSGETEVTGLVFEINDSGDTLTLPGANIYWAGTTTGSSTDAKGRFSISHNQDSHLLVVSYVGYGSDTLHIHHPTDVTVFFNNTLALEEVRITHRIKASALSFQSPFHLRQISEKELTRAACCNLSESFETNPGVDGVSTDAVTGLKTIELLGLASPYVQIMRENIPDTRGLAALYGLSFTPGPWVKGMQLNTGTGSVVNGFESMTGQINVELRKPDDDESLRLNLYGNQAGRAEFNLTAPVLNRGQWGSQLLLHANTLRRRSDHNEDGFMDHPTGDQIIAMQRLHFKNENGFESQAGIKLTWLDQLGGELAYRPDAAASAPELWGMGMHQKRMDTWLKAGKIFPDRPYSSLGFQMAASIHDLEAGFGRRSYTAREESLYANLIYQSILGNTNHQFRSGLSMQADFVEESFDGQHFDVREPVPGAFLEYTFNHMDVLTAVAGFRVDRHPDFGWFTTPRLHVKWTVDNLTIVRLSAGRGFRTASILSENIGYMASSRRFVLHPSHANAPYGLGAERAHTLGLNIARRISSGDWHSTLSVDLYHTGFQTQLISDPDMEAGALHLYMLEGRSFANNVQFQGDIGFGEFLELSLAYRLVDARTTYGGRLLSRHFSARHRAFASLSYTLPERWQFDLTWSWRDGQRLPSLSGLPEPYSGPDNAPAYSLFHIQVTRHLNKGFSLYAGAENLLNFRQEDAIIAARDPFGPYFDAARIWGPVFGRKLYAGLRFTL